MGSGSATIGYVRCMRMWIVILALFLVGCGESDTPAPTSLNPFPPLGLGVVYGLSDSQGALGRPSLQGAQLAAEQSSGQAVLTVADAGSEVRAAVASVLTSSPSAVMGLTDSDQVLAGAPVATAAGRLFLTSGATSPLLPSQVPGTFLACFGDNAQAAAGAEYAFNTLGARRVSIVYDPSSSYTRLLQTYFQTRFVELGGTVVAKSTYPTLPALAGADLVYFAAQPSDVVAGVGALRAAGYTGSVMGGDGFDFSYTASGVYFTTHADLTSSDPMVTRFVSSYRSRYGVDPDAFAALGYDTVNLLLQLRALGGNDAVNLRNSFLSLGRFRGVTGDFVYQGTSGVPIKPVTVVRVEGSGRIPVSSFVPTGVPAADTPFLP